MYETYSGDNADEQARVAYLMQLFGQTRQRRVNYEIQWEEAASLCWPEYRNTFAYGHYRPPGAKYTQFQVDSSGAIAAHRFMAICDTLMTPYNMMWSKVIASNKDLMKERAAKEYFSDVTHCLWCHRYRPDANFAGNNQQNWQALGVFGNMGMLAEPADMKPARARQGLRYIGLGPGEIYLLTNHQGWVDGYIRSFKWTARQAFQRWGEKCPPVLRTALEQNSSTLFDFLQFVLPRTDYDPFKILTPQGKPWCSIYVSVAGFCILEEGGYRTFPLAHGRYMVAPEEEYGRGPAQIVLPELKTLNSEKEAFLKQGALAGDPAYLLPEDGLFDFKTASGSYNYGGMNEEGRKLVDVLPTGNIQITEEMMKMSQRAVDDAFLVSLFPSLRDDSESIQRSAREVIENANERGMFLAPLGRQYGEYLGTLIDRELDILAYQGLLPKVPEVLKEARGDYTIVYTSTLAQAIFGQPIAGYMRTVEMATQIAQATGDTSVFDAFDFKTAIPEMAEKQHAPINWMATAAMMAASAKQRAAAAKAERDMKALPGQAAIMKAQAINSKAQAGMNIGGTLSGMPAGGMPVVPPQAPRGVPGVPGRNGRPGLPGRRGR